ARAVRPQTASSLAIRSSWLGSIRAPPNRRNPRRKPKSNPQEMLARHQTYTRAHFEDMPEVRDWIWTDM
ncbi:MAG: hypothetical protein ACXU95_18410, partial [Isosphaeraceae bacterium]